MLLTRSSDKVMTELLIVGTDKVEDAKDERKPTENYTLLPCWAYQDYWIASKEDRDRTQRRSKERKGCD